MLITLLGFAHAAVAERVRTIRALAGGERGQGTVEYVGLILLVSLLMVGMVAAMKGFNGQQGTELASLIVDKISRGRRQGRVQIERERTRAMPDSRSYDRAPADIRPVDDRARIRRDRGRLGADLDRQDAGDLHGLGQRLGAALDAGAGPRLGHRRVLDASRLDRRPQAARHLEGQAGRARGRDPAPDRPLAAGRRRLRGARRTQRLRRLRRAPGRRRHPLRGDHRRLRRPAAGAAEAGRREARSSGCR